jgi:sterol desaturase/sphingolipid hydroxylase (fatty acid hydroxylase superfamily)/creatinine amidohydrolase/Fe(II)-dependent formamide hydrolase-like protein
MIFEDAVARGAHNLLAFTAPGNRLFVLYLLTALVIAVVTYFVFRERDPEQRPEKVEAGLLRYIFDPSVYFHKSAIQDYLYFIINGFIYHGIIAQLLISGHFFFTGSFYLLTETFGAPEEAVFEVTPLTVAAYTLVAILIYDFAVFITHYLQHRVPVLWQFHQVHHSAEVLNPVTVARMHPVDLFFTGLVSIALGSFAIALFTYLTKEVVSAYEIMGRNVVLFLFYLLGYNLRHSHIWVNYPAWLANVFISPAQHQIHHSVEPRHFDRNYGFIFSFWDRLFGSLYYPRKFERLSFGVNKRERNPFPTVLSLYIKPFQNAWAIIAPKDARVLRRAGMAGWLVIFVAFYFGLYAISTAERGYAPPSVHLEDLTWTEIRKAVDAGYTRVIVPTGGTEQNGPHVILGKHNYVVRATAERIAAELGNTLVAPVIAYVPEGPVSPEPSGHMRFAGTLTIGTDVFQAMIAWAVESYAAHGFEIVYLIGDSGGNQESQAAVAAAYAQDGRIAVHHIGDYYAANGQVDWLLQQGFTEAEIGRHAGIRDTSELLAAHPAGVRQEQGLVLPDDSGNLGSSGERSLASAEIGEKMLDLKVQAALRQIRALP